VTRINKTRWTIIGVILVLVIASLASYNSIHEYYVKCHLIPGEVLQDALNNMAASDSYRFSMHSGFTVEERREVISEVEGERENGNTHIKGEMVNTPVDIYYLDQIIYNYDAAAKKWLVIDSGTSNSEELLISELNPLSNFRFKNVDQVQKVRFEDVDGVECLLVQCNPIVESGLLDNLWKDFQYNIWVDWKSDLIKKATLTAASKRSDKTNLEIDVGFSDFGKKLEIKAPMVSSTNKNQ
jgi:hypothetical protein